MARFRLKDKHYLSVPGTEWEQKETDQASGKQARKIYRVPLYLDPEQQADQNYPGEIIVSTKHDPRTPRDIVFEGPPTPDMEPLDDEARKLMDQMKWSHPIESLEGTFSERMLDDLQRQVDAAALKITSAKDDRIAKLEKQVEELTTLLKKRVA